MSIASKQWVKTQDAARTLRQALVPDAEKDEVVVIYLAVYSPPDPHMPARFSHIRLSAKRQAPRSNVTETGPLRGILPG